MLTLTYDQSLLVNSPNFANFAARYNGFFHGASGIGVSGSTVTMTMSQAFPLAGTQYDYVFNTAPFIENLFGDLAPTETAFPLNVI